MKTLTDHFTLERPFIWFDVETTGPDPAKDRVVQLAMKVYFEDGRVSTYKSLINPGIPIPADVVKIHGISDEVIKTGCGGCHRRDADHPAEGCDKFKEVPTFAAIAAGLHKGFIRADFGGYNVKFDLRMMTAEFTRAGLPPFDWKQSIIIDGFRLWQLLEKRTLSDAVERWLKRKLEGAHDAMNDIISTEEVVMAQLAHTVNGERVLPKTLREIHDLQWPVDKNAIDSENKFVFINGVACLNFGKHKGRPMKDCMDYLKWMWGADFSREVKDIIDKALAGQFPRQG